MGLNNHKASWSDEQIVKRRPKESSLGEPSQTCSNICFAFALQVCLEIFPFKPISEAPKTQGPITTAYPAYIGWAL